LSEVRGRDTVFRSFLYSPLSESQKKKLDELLEILSQKWNKELRVLPKFRKTTRQDGCFLNLLIPDTIPRYYCTQLLGFLNWYKEIF
jgi:hypothetical protein